MKELYDRFGLSVDFNDSVVILKNKIENLLIDGQIGEDLLEQDRNIAWRYNNRLGLRHNSYPTTQYLVEHLLPRSLQFKEYLLRLQVVFDVCWEINEQNVERFAKSVEIMLNDSPIDLGVKIKIFKTKAPKVLLVNSKRARKQVEATLDDLEQVSWTEVQNHYEAALKELFQAKTPGQLKDVAEDISTACDEAIKEVFQEKNLGLKHLFKEDRWKQIGMTGLQKRVFSDFNKWLDEIKHAVIKDYNKSDIENLIYLGSELISFLSTVKPTKNKKTKA